MSLVRAGFVSFSGGPEPGFDHADVWLGAGGPRLFVAHTGADRVDMIDCAAHRFVGSIDDLPGVAGVLIDQEHDLLFTSDRAVARVSVFRASDTTQLGQVAVGQYPNGLAYDRRRRRLYSFNVGDVWSASVVDVDSLQVIAEVALPGRPRWALDDGERDVIYANIREPAEIIVIDAERLAIKDAFAVPSAGPHGLGLDGRRLFCAADGGELVVLDCESGDVLQSLPLPGVPDVVMLDDGLRRLFVAIGDPGLVCAFDIDGLERLETVATEHGAHTIGWDPTNLCLYAFCPESCGALVFEEHG